MGDFGGLDVHPFDDLSDLDLRKDLRQAPQVARAGGGLHEGVRWGGAGWGGVGRGGVALWHGQAQQQW